eukprot:gene11834-5164_t
MIIPKTMKTYCSGHECKSHQEHIVSQYKASASRDDSQGNRRYNEKQKGYGGQTKPIFRKKAKTTRIVSLKLKCSKCHKVQQRPLDRTKRLEFVRVSKE